MKISEFIAKFEAYLLTERRVAENTFMAYKRDLAQFERYCHNQQLRLDALNSSHLRNYLQFLQQNGISPRSLARKITTLKGLFSYGANRFELIDYAHEIALPQVKKELPSCLSEDEMMRFFSTCEQDQSTLGKRNAVMLYLMYVSGMRVSELIALRTNSVHRENGVIAVEGKGGRQRMVPLPDSMMTLLIDYLDTTRSQILKKGYSSDFLFPVIYGKKVKPLTRQAFWGIVKQLWKKAEIDRPMSPHTLRHSFATHMLQKGANLRSLQVLLGHEQLTTVQVYTHMDTSYLRKIYNKKHPRSE